AAELRIDEDDNLSGVDARLTLPDLSAAASSLEYDRLANEFLLATATLDVDLADVTAHASAREILICDDREGDEGDAADARPASSISLRDVFFTTCPETDRGRARAWDIRAREIELEGDEGVARGVRFKIKGVTVFRSPYFSFPRTD